MTKTLKPQQVFHVKWEEMELETIPSIITIEKSKNNGPIKDFTCLTGQEFNIINNWCLDFGHELLIKNKQAAIRYKTLQNTDTFCIFTKENVYSDIHKILYLNRINGKIIAENTLTNNTWYLQKTQQELVIDYTIDCSLSTRYVTTKRLASPRECGMVIQLDLLKEAKIHSFLNKLI